MGFPSMKAIRIDACGGPEVLRVRDLPAPKITAPGEVLVRLRAAGVNPVDVKIRSNAATYGLQPPLVPGCDGAGVVEAVGPDVRDLGPGDEVYFCRGPFHGHSGTYAEYAVIDARYCARKPANLSFEQAAAVPLVLITAWEALFDRARLEPGASVLVHAGAGGVGHVAIQLARRHGARVCTTAGGAQKAAFARDRGAHQVIDYRNSDFVAEAVAFSGGRGVDVVLDTVGGKTLERSCAALRPYGDLVTLLVPPADMDWSAARPRNLRVCLQMMLGPIQLRSHEDLVRQAGILERGRRMIEDGELDVHLHATLPLQDAAEAHRLVGGPAVCGKIVLAI